MKRIRIYIAQSLDGYIARKDNSLDWLENYPNPDALDYGYNDLIASIDTIVMGRKTYDFLSNCDIDWPYADSTTYIVSRNLKSVKTPSCIVTAQLTAQFFVQLRENTEKDIWIVGGGEIVSSVVAMGIVDELELFTLPVLLGDGVPLFTHTLPEMMLTLTSSEHYSNGMVRTVYTCK